MMTPLQTRQLKSANSVRLQKSQNSTKTSCSTVIIILLLFKTSGQRRNSTYSFYQGTTLKTSGRYLQIRTVLICWIKWKKWLKCFSKRTGDKAILLKLGSIVHLRLALTICTCTLLNIPLRAGTKEMSPMLPVYFS